MVRFFFYINNKSKIDDRFLFYNLTYLIELLKFKNIVYQKKNKSHNLLYYNCYECDLIVRIP